MTNIVSGTRSYLFIGGQLNFTGSYASACHIRNATKGDSYIYTVFLNSKFPPDWEDKDGNEIDAKYAPADYRTIILMLGE